MRVGIFGAGLQGCRHGAVLLNSTPSRRTMQPSLRPGWDVRPFEGWESMVDREDLDALVVATPPHLHAPISIAVMRKGKHVPCEKPLARTLDEAEAMVAMARVTGRVLKCGFNPVIIRHSAGATVFDGAIALVTLCSFAPVAAPEAGPATKGSGGRTRRW